MITLLIDLLDLLAIVLMRGISFIAENVAEVVGPVMLAESARRAAMGPKS